MDARSAWRALLAGEAPASLTPLLFARGRHGAAARRRTPVWCRARGTTVVDIEGRRYLDLSAGFGAAILGHAHPAVVRALRAQARTLVHGFGDVHPHAGRAALAAELARLAPLPRARLLWAQHGAEAVELAWRSAYLDTGRPGIVAFRGGYHGLTLGALSVTGWDEFRAPFRPLLVPPVAFVPYPPCARCSSGDFGCIADDLDRAERSLRRRGGVGAVLVEPVQGRGGAVVPPRGWLAALAREVRRRGWRLIADEILTGFGRTGRRFAVEHERVVPDLVCVGKSIASGMPLAAVLGRDTLLAPWRRIAARGEAAHAATFLAHPMSCAAALATLRVWRRERLWSRAARAGRSLRSGLRDLAAEHAAIGEVRGRGLLLGLAIVDRRGRADARRAAAIVAAALHERLLVVGGGIDGNVISLTPSLLLRDHERQHALRRLSKALRAAGV